MAAKPKRGRHRRFEAYRRLKVILPCLGVMFLLAALMTSWVPILSIGEFAKIWSSIMSGPLACWIGLSWHFTPEEKTHQTLVAAILALGILSHPLYPRAITAVITVLASCLWLPWGMVLTYGGWG